MGWDRRKCEPYERHVRLHHWLLGSPAYRQLSVGGRALLVELYDLHNGMNNGELFLSVREAGARLNVGKDTAGRYFRELEAKGFIRPRTKGSFDYKARHATCWVLTEFSYAGQLPTKDFMKWRPAEKQKPVPKIRTDGPQNRDRTGRKNAA